MVSSKEDERSLFVSGIVKNKDKYLFWLRIRNNGNKTKTAGCGFPSARWKAGLPKGKRLKAP